MMESTAGKIHVSEFEDFISGHCGFQRKEIVSGPKFGVDVSIAEIGEGKVLASCSDPLSLIPSLGLEESAYLSVHLAVNDMATMGFKPQFAQMVLNLSANLSQEDFKTYWKYIDGFAKEIELGITGGHTGFIEGQNSTIAGGITLQSILDREKYLVSDRAEEGDVLLITKTCAISSAAILALSFPETVIHKVGRESYLKASEDFWKISSLKDALVAVGNDLHRIGISAMHDVTEGGVLGAVYEMAIASGNGVLIEAKNIPLENAQTEVCKVFNLDSRYCIGAGSMLISCKKNAVSEVKKRLQESQIEVHEIGVFQEKDFGLKIIEKGEIQNLPYFEKDPYWKAFFTALKNGWK